MATACSTSSSHDDKPKIFREKNIDAPNARLTPEILWQLAAVSAPSVSPDGETLLFNISYANIQKNKSAAEVYKMNADGSGPISRITNGHGTSATQPAFAPNNRIAFLKNKKTEYPFEGNPIVSQLVTVNANGNDEHVATDSPDDVNAFLFSPNGKHIALVRRVVLDQNIHDLYPDLPKANARIETDLMYRHWNAWADGSFSHIFIANYDGRDVLNEQDIMPDERFHSPLRPFGGIEQIAWSPDSKKLAYTCKKLEGINSALSTNSDIYIYDLETKETINVSAPNPGYDTNPTFSSDNNKLFWLSMPRNGYESDRNRIICKDLTTNKVTDLTANSELYISQFVLSNDNKDIWFIANNNARDAIFHLDPATGAINQLTTDTADYTSLAIAKNNLIATRTTFYQPPEINIIDPQTGCHTNISNVNTQSLAKINFGHTEERWLTTSDGKKMQTWVVYPPDFDPSRQYPALLYCQGGPQNTVSQFWSRRWNFALMAANGYIVVAPNRRGVPGFGVEWNEQISKDYGGQNMQDYLTAIDSLSAEPYIDSSKLGCVGASYGGFSVYWLAGHHEKRFSAFLAHCGIFNLEQLYSTTEELFFVNWDLGGPYWDKNNLAAQRSFAQSPHLFVGNWDTPIMVVHGEKDFRIPYTQGMGAFNVAKMRGLEAEFLYFPDECHWVTSPQNSILWHREFYRWLDRWLK